MSKETYRQGYERAKDDLMAGRGRMESQKWLLADPSRDNDYNKGYSDAERGRSFHYPGEKRRWWQSW
jgi:hypothetical protein